MRKSTKLIVSSTFKITGILLLSLLFLNLSSPIAIQAIIAEEDPAPADQNQGEETQLRIRLHERLLAHNSETTRIDQMNQEQLRNVENFTLHVVSKNKVTFQNALDLSAKETITKLEDLDEYIDFEKTGKVTIDTDYLDFLDSPATITMYNLPFNQTPQIYKDGKLVTTEEVSNVVYVYSQTEGGTLSFDVNSFSTFEARGVSEETSADQEKQTDLSHIRLLLIIGLITVQGVVVAVVVKLIEKKRTAETIVV